MRKERRNLLLAAMLTVAMVGGLAWLIFRNHGQPEPVYQGKRLNKWLEGAFVDARSTQAVREIGTNGIPTLLRMLRARDSNIRLKIIGLAQKQHIIKFHFVDAVHQNWEASLGFAALRAVASNAVPPLIQIYEDDISRTSKMSAAAALGYIGPAATAAVPALLRTITNTNADAGLRENAVDALGGIHSQPGLVLPALTKCLSDSAPNVRAQAASALASFGSDAKTAVPALVDLLKDPDPTARWRALQALKAINPEAAANAGIQ